MGLDLSFTRLDKILITVAVGISVLSAGSLATPNLFDSKKTDTKNSALEAAGETQSVQNDIRRRANQSMVWQTLTEKSQIYFNESIYSGNDSEASIRTADGSVFNLEPNSMVLLEKFEGRLALDLKLGGMQAELQQGQTMVLRAQGFSTTVKADSDRTQFAIRKESKHKATVQLQKGSGKATANNEVKVLAIENKLTLDDQEKTAELTKIAIQLLKPTSGETLWLKPESTTTLQWKADAPGQIFKVLISKKSDFAEPVFSTTTLENFISVPNLSKGVYFWQVRSENLNNESIGTFRVKKISAAVPYFPADKALLTAGPTPLIWENPSDAKTFQIQVSRTPDFAKMLVDQTTSAQEFRIDLTEPGPYFWRVQTKDVEGIATSPVSSFQLQAPVVEAVAEPVAEPVAPAAPVVAAEAVPVPQPTQAPSTQPIAKVVPLTAPNLITPSLRPNLSWNSAKNYFEPPVTLAWKKVAAAQTYKLEITSLSDEKFLAPTLQKSMTVTNFKWTATGPGEFLWRVLAESKDQSAASAAGRISANLSPPQVVVAATTFCKPLPAVCPAVELTISTSPPPAIKTKIEIAQTSDFAKILKTTATRDSKIQVADLKEGVYYLRSSFIGADTKPISSELKAVTFKIEREVNSPLPAPQLLAPPENMSLVIFGDRMEPLLFKWSPAAAAESYVIQISASTDFKTIFAEEKTAKTSFILKTTPQTTRLFWRVKGVSKDREGTWSAVRTVLFEK